MNAKFSMLLAMFIFGTMGPFVRCAELPAEYIALARSGLGGLILLAASFALHQHLRWTLIKKHLPRLFLLGSILGINWVFFFEAYKTTTVAIATVIYYLAPVFVTIFSPLVFKERLTKKQVICVFVALFGMTLVSGLWNSTFSAGQMLGVLWAFAAALCYTAIVFLNKVESPLTGLESTLTQFGASFVILSLYILFFSDSVVPCPSPLGLLSLLIVCAVHTGLAYILYFGSIKKLPGQTIAIFSFVDPLTAIALSVLVLQEPLSLPSFCGAVLILGSTLFSELKK